MSKKQVYLFFQSFILILLVLFSIVYLLMDINPESLIYSLSIFMVLICIWVIFSWGSLTRSYFDPYIIFLIAAILFNGGHIILKVFNLNPNGILTADYLLARASFSSEIILKTIYLVILGLSFFHFGSLLSIKRKYYLRKLNRKKTLADNRVCRRVGLLLILIGFIPSLLIYSKAIKIVLIGGYNLLVSYNSSMGYGSFFRILSKLFVPGSLFLLAGSQKKKSGIILSLIAIYSYVGIEFFLGSRSSAVGALIAYTWVWDQCIYSIPKFILSVSGTITLFVLLPLVRVSRKLLGSTDLSLYLFIRAYSSIDNPAVSIIREMGSSMGTIAHTLRLIPIEESFNLGTNYFYALSSIFPNLFWEVHPATNHLPSKWLARKINPVMLAEGRGVGYSFIAESYLNFGWFGAPLILCLLGFLFGKLVIWAKSSGHSSRVAMVASFFGFSFIFARGAFIQIVRPLFWYSFIPYILTVFLSKVRFK